MTNAAPSAAVQAVLQPVLAAAAASAEKAGVRLLLGAGSPGVPLADAGTPLMIIPALGPDSPHAWEVDRLGRTPAIGLLDRSEALFLRGAHPEAPTVMLGMPEPVRRQMTYGLDMGDAPDHMDIVWAEEQGDVPIEGPGVTWIQGSGAVPLSQGL